MEVAAIEKELRELWKEMADPAHTAHPVTRACVHNLMICAPGEKGDAEVTGLIAEITDENPGRVILMLPKPDASTSRLDAWVSAQCHLASGGRKQVCCEQITIRAEGESVQQLSSAVIPLLVPDLPVFLWWREGELSGSTFEDLVEISDRLILHSATFPNAVKVFQELSALIQRLGEWTAVSDLAWAELNPWRSSIAEFYDIPECRSHLERLRKIEICFPYSVQALLLIGWLAASMQWKLESSLQRPDEFQLNSSHGPISVRLKAGDSFSNLRPSVLLLTDQAAFEVALTEDNSYLQATSTSGTRKLSNRISAMKVAKESELIAKELEILGHDRSYETSIGWLCDLCDLCG